MGVSVLCKYCTRELTRFLRLLHNGAVLPVCALGVLGRHSRDHRQILGWGLGQRGIPHLQQEVPLVDDPRTWGNGDGKYPKKKYKTAWPERLVIRELETKGKGISSGPRGCPNPYSTTHIFSCLGIVNMKIMSFLPFHSTPPLLYTCKQIPDDNINVPRCIYYHLIYV